MLISKLTSQVIEEGFSVKAEWRLRDKTYFFSGHIDDGVKIEDAFQWIREAIGRIEGVRQEKKEEGTECHT
jgi:hypothetical protein